MLQKLLFASFYCFTGPSYRLIISCCQEEVELRRTAVIVVCLCVSILVHILGYKLPKFLVFDSFHIFGQSETTNQTNKLCLL